MIGSLVPIKLNGAFNLVSNVSQILAPMCAYQDSTTGDVRAINCDIDRQNGGPDYLRIIPSEDSKLAKANGSEILFNQTLDNLIVTQGDNNVYEISTITKAMIKSSKVNRRLLNWVILTSPDNLNRNSSSGPLPVRIVPQNIRTGQCVTIDYTESDTLTPRQVTPPAGTATMNMFVSDCDSNNPNQEWWLNEFVQLQISPTPNI